MKVNVANPIYDTVFKYLMEDERIARTLLSALLRKEVLAVEARPHEYTNLNRDTISMFRIDFSARVSDGDGTDHLVLIELQKTWVGTETLRFRQYLGAQYSHPRNMQADGRYGLPMVAVYILGHRVGDIEEPVVYFNHHAEDYAGNRITKGMPDPFVESLTHDSIIVQVPLLHGQVGNRLEKVLTVFDQTKAAEGDSRLLQIDETQYADDADMQYIVHRLTAAAADADMRHQMNVEDEYFSVIENSQTELMKAKAEIKTQQEAIKEQQDQIAAKDRQMKAMVQALLENGLSEDAIERLMGQ